MTQCRDGRSIIVTAGTGVPSRSALGAGRLSGNRYRVNVGVNLFLFCNRLTQYNGIAAATILNSLAVFGRSRLFRRDPGTAGFMPEGFGSRFRISIAAATPVCGHTGLGAGRLRCHGRCIRMLMRRIVGTAVVSGIGTIVGTAVIARIGTAVGTAVRTGTAGKFGYALRLLFSASFTCSGPYALCGSGGSSSC